MKYLETRILDKSEQENYFVKQVCENSNFFIIT